MGVIWEVYGNRGPTFARFVEFPSNKSAHLVRHMFFPDPAGKVVDLCPPSAVATSGSTLPFLGVGTTVFTGFLGSRRQKKDVRSEF